jgi:hypothetical protein
LLVKQRTVSISLQIRRYLKPRMSFSDKDLRQLKVDEKGFEGECLFDQLIDKSPASTYLQLRDLYLHRSNSPFQLDSIIITPHKIYLSDVKNYEGEVYIEGDRWYYLSGRELKNPLLQLERSESLFRPLLHSLGINLPIESKVVFVNPDFTLFQANKNLPIILPSQVNSFLYRLGSVSMSAFNQRLIDAARNLALQHLEDPPQGRTLIPEYSYDPLKKGVPCVRCWELSVRLCGRYLICDICGCKESVTAGVQRNIDEHKLLFPNRFITVSAMIDWCGLDLSHYRMQKILVEYLLMAGSGKAAYYY